MTMRTSPLKTLLPRGRSPAMSGYCPWPGSEFCAGSEVAGGTAGGGGAVAESMWPSIGAIEDPSSIAANFVQQKQHADGDDHRRTHQTAYGAPRAPAADSITHRLHLS